MEEVAGVFKEGGERNSFGAGVVVGAKLLPQHVSAVIGRSSGLGLGSYFAAGQIALAQEIFIERLNRSEVYSIWNPLRGRPVYNVHYLIDTCCADLNVERLINEGPPVYGGVFRARDGQTLFLRLERHNCTLILKATGALPLIGGGIRFPDGDLYYDGGIVGDLDVKFAYEVLGFKRILVICNRPLGTRSRPPARILTWAAFRRSPEARRALSERSIEAARSFMASPPADLTMLTIAPDAELPVGRMPGSPALAKQAYDIGLAKGLEVRDTVMRFCEGK